MTEPEQLQLSNPDENKRGQHHRGAGDTERGAAYRQLPKSGTDRRTVLDFLAGCGIHGATDYEISQETGLRQYTAAPRRYELVKGGWVEDSGLRRDTDSGSPAIVWRMTVHGAQGLRLVS